MAEVISLDFINMGTPYNFIIGLVSWKWEAYLRTKFSILDRLEAHFSLK